MLNSEDLQQLKIEALIENPSVHHSSSFCADFLPVFSPASSDHILIRNSSNSNILAFCYVLLAHIFDLGSTKDRASVSSKTLSEPKSERGHDTSSKTNEQISADFATPKHKERDEAMDPTHKLCKLYGFLYSEKTNLAQISNIPHKLQALLTSICKPEATSQAPQQLTKKNINFYLKKILIQFLKFVCKNCSAHSSLSNKEGELSAPPISAPKPFCIVKAFQQYRISEIIISILMRSILYFEYEVAQALDYSESISDHTVYTALCDAFQYNSLRLQENYTEIWEGSFIRIVRIKQFKESVNAPGKKSRNISSYYLVSLPLWNAEGLASREIQDIDSFRMRRRSIDDSNNESVSFRQNSKHPTHKKNVVSSSSNAMNIISNKVENKAETVPIKNGENDEKGDLPPPKRKRKEQFEASMFSTPKNKTANDMEEATIRQKPIRQQTENPQLFPIISVTSAQNHAQAEQAQPAKRVFPSQRCELTGYTNLSILNQLSPQIRDSMLKNIGHYRNLVS